MLVLFVPTIESVSVVARALHILSDLYLICCANKDLCSTIIVEKELHMANLLYSSSYSQTIDFFIRTLQFVPEYFSEHVQIFLTPRSMIKLHKILRTKNAPVTI